MYPDILMRNYKHQYFKVLKGNDGWQEIDRTINHYRINITDIVHGLLEGLTVDDSE